MDHTLTDLQKMTAAERDGWVRSFVNPHARARAASLVAICLNH